MIFDDGVRELIADLVTADPWERSFEGLDDACHFCGSNESWWGPPPGARRWDCHGYYFHRDNCPWIRGRYFLGRERDDHHLLLSERPDWLAKLTPNAGRYW